MLMAAAVVLGPAILELLLVLVRATVEYQRLSRRNPAPRTTRTNRTGRVGPITLAARVGLVFDLCQPMQGFPSQHLRPHAPSTLPTLGEERMPAFTASIVCMGFATVRRDAYGWAGGYSPRVRQGST